MRIEDQWTLDRDRGFTWWAAEYAQSVWSDLGNFHNGVTLYRLHAEIELVRGRGHATQCEVPFTQAMCDANLSAITYDPHTDLYKLHCSVYAHEDNKEWLKRVFLAAVALQVVDAELSAPVLAGAFDVAPACTTHPRSGSRLLRDPVLHAEEKFFRPSGAQRSRWIGSDEWGEARSRVGRIAQHAVTDGKSYLEAEFDWCVSGHTLPIRLEIKADKPHHRLGSGLCAHLYMPLAMAVGSRAHTALELNALERKEWNWCHDLGSWCCEGPDLAFRCFVPNISYSRDILPELGHDMAIRAGWVNDMFAHGLPITA
ncbi:MAG: hypothetical protein HYR64_04620 [Fimbriimonas ginsengisoli]|uniref:Uncharacterized protein n=1 Tax=Fimbriimonas ginsengisoli TaxID=1005039 RepID=A0A931PVK8_FIMGI|nr:hypothetical protein [Fimbriimonas ginsengisoli]